MLSMTGMQSNEESGLADELNKSLGDAFLTGAAYSSVHALMLHWEEDDLNVMSEIETLQQLFEERLRFQTTVLPIPSCRSQASLHNDLSSFIFTHGASKENLVIIYYAGHGDANADQRKAVWAAKRKDGPTLNWYEVQPAIFAADSDVLLIFDCCYAAQAARGRESRVVEMLAASGINNRTPPPSAYSFTTVLIRIMERMLQAEQKVVVYDLFKRLLQDTGKDEEVYETPFHFLLAEGEGSIVLRPVQNTLSSDVYPNEPPLALISLSISLTQKPNLLSMRQLSKWLKNATPRSISAIAVEELLLRTECIQAFLHRSQTRKLQFAIASDLQDRSQPDSVTFSSLHPLRTDYEGRSPEIEAKGIITRLQTWNDQVYQSMESNLFLNPDFASAENIQQLEGDRSAQPLGLNNAARLRLLNSGEVDAATPDQPLPRGSFRIQEWPRALRNSDRQENNGVIGYGFVDDNLVVIEYRPYGDIGSQEDTAKKVKRLATLLKQASNLAFQLSPFIGYLHDPLHKTFGLVFKTPFRDARTSDPCHTSLCNEISRLKFFPLDRRMEIAIALTRGMSSLHAVGWLHKSFCSENILFFRSEVEVETEESSDSSSGKFDLSRPHLFGFDLSRPQNAISDQTREFRSGRLIYTHPNRWGRPSEVFSTIHDIYALGVTLLEIGCWRQAERMDKAGKGFRDVDHEGQVRAALLDVARTQLPHMAGIEFSRAVITCLDGSLEHYVQGEDSSKQHKAFGKLVLDRIVKARIGL